MKVISSSTRPGILCADLQTCRSEIERLKALRLNPIKFLPKGIFAVLNNTEMKILGLVPAIFGGIAGFAMKSVNPQIFIALTAFEVGLIMGTVAFSIFTIASAYTSLDVQISMAERKLKRLCKDNNINNIDAFLKSRHYLPHPGNPKQVGV